jgi:hypothetical protein
MEDLTAKEVVIWIKEYVAAYKMMVSEDFGRLPIEIIISDEMHKVLLEEYDKERKFSGKVVFEGKPVIGAKIPYGMILVRGKE